MKKKILALAAVCAFAFNAFGITLAAANPTEKAKQTSQLAALLPASDAVMTLDIQRLFGEALPQILSGNQPMLADIVGKIDEMKAKTGFDLRQFEQVAIGVSSRKTAAREMEFAPVLLARGSFNAGALIALGKIAVGSKGSNIKYREEKAGGDRTIYVFTSPVVFKTVPLPNKPNMQPQKSRSVFEKAIDKMFQNLSHEFAVAAYDDNTLAIGSPARVRETLAAAVTHLDGDVSDLISRRPDAIVNFGLRTPNGMADFVPDLGSDEISKNIGAIRYLSVSADVSGGAATTAISAKTLKPEQAKSLQEQLEGLRMIGKGFLGGSKSADKIVFGRMIENLKIARNVNEVTLDLQVSQSDINVLLDKLKTAGKTAPK